MEITGIISLKRGMISCLFLAYLAIGLNLYSQETTYNYFYRVYFKDKGDIIINYTPEDLISQKAIIRRQKANIPVPDFRDYPVNTTYINQIIALGFRLHCTSKWLNTALFKTQNQTNTSIILNLAFVKDVKLVKNQTVKSFYDDKLDFHLEQSDVPAHDSPVVMLNGYPVHNSGYDGTGIIIAVLDGGFLDADKISSLNTLRGRYGLLGTYDFVANNVNVYNYHNHGTAVLSVLAGKIPWQIEGTAPGANYWLLRTEDSFTEFPVEEDYWVAGAEFADSVGADIISSSLGYYNFDNPAMNYKFSDMDGNTTFVTQAADIAASKGILVVNSAGNERNKPWKQIIAPSDGDSVIAVGAVDASKFISTFSSAGPSADGRTKPDNVAQGVSVPVQTSVTAISRSNGTSFSCPVLSGMCACLMQAVPKALNEDIINAIHTNADRYNSPDSLYGYGIPDMVKVLSYLQDILTVKPYNETIVGPNPFTYDVEVTFRETPGRLRVDIFTISGKVIVKKNYQEYIGRTFKISDLQNKEAGIYFIRLTTANGISTHKVIKLNTGL
jgi:serine protease AprX